MVHPWRRTGSVFGKKGAAGYPEQSGVYDLRSPYLNLNFANPIGEIQYLTTGAHVFTVPADVTNVSFLCIGGGGGGMYFNNSSSTFTYRMNGGGGGGSGWSKWAIR